jgi:hypothetical protein
MADQLRRSIEKATFVSIQPSPEDVRSGAVEKRQRGLEKIAFVSSLRASPREVLEARREHASDPDVVAGLGAIGAALAGGSKSRAAWREIARTPAKANAAAGRALASHRAATREELRKSAQALIASHLEYVRREAEHNATPAAVVSPPPADPLERGALAADALGPLTDPPGPNPWEPQPTSDPRLAAPALRSSLATAFFNGAGTDPLSARPAGVTTARP